MTPTPNNKPSAMERMQMIQKQANAPIVCEKCGSVWFTDTGFHQFSGSRYSSTPGGDLQVVSALQQRIRVCLCGHPYAPNLGGVRPGRTAASEVTSFMQSFQLAKAYLNSIGKLDDTQMATDFVTRDEYQKLVVELEAVKKQAAGAIPGEPLVLGETDAVSRDEYQSLIVQMDDLRRQISVLDGTAVTVVTSTDIPAVVTQEPATQEPPASAPPAAAGPGRGRGGNRQVTNGK